MKSLLKGIWIWRQSLSLLLCSLCPQEVLISLKPICKHGSTICVYVQLLAICYWKYYSICTSLIPTGEKPPLHSEVVGKPVHERMAIPGLEWTPGMGQQVRVLGFWQERIQEWDIKEWKQLRKDTRSTECGPPQRLEWPLAVEGLSF